MCGTTLGTPFLSSRLEAGVMAARSSFFPPVVVMPLVFFGGGVTTSFSVAGTLGAGDLNAGERAVEIFGTLSDPDAVLSFAAPLDSSRLADGRERLLNLQRLWKSFNRRLNRNFTIRDF